MNKISIRSNRRGNYSTRMKLIRHIAKRKELFTEKFRVILDSRREIANLVHSEI